MGRERLVVGGGVEGFDEAQPGQRDPSGDVYDWYQRALELLDEGSASAAVQLLDRVTTAAPELRSVREALARAQFDSKMYAEAERTFGSITAQRPDDDYALYGLGMALSRLGRFDEAVEHLALAVAMRPDRREYSDALRQARATVRARRPGR